MGDFARSFSTEDGNNYRVESQDLTPAIERVKKIRDAEAALKPGQNPHDRHFIGSIPWSMLIDWLNARGYTIDQWARNEGGTRCAFGEDPVAHATMDGGIKSEFLRWFLSRDNSKLHTEHVTTKKGSSRIFMPGN